MSDAKLFEEVGLDGGNCVEPGVRLEARGLDSDVDGADTDVPGPTSGMEEEPPMPAPEC